METKRSLTCYSCGKRGNSDRDFSIKKSSKSVVSVDRAAKIVMQPKIQFTMMRGLKNSRSISREIFDSSASSHMNGDPSLLHEP